MLAQCLIRQLMLAYATYRHTTAERAFHGFLCAVLTGTRLPPTDTRLPLTDTRLPLTTPAVRLQVRMLGDSTNHIAIT